MRARARLSIEVGVSTIRVQAGRRGRVIWAAEATYAGVGELSERLGELVSVEALPAAERLVDVRLLPPLAQVRLLDDLPRVGEAGLAGILAHQPQRFFRKNGKPLVTDGAWVGSGLRRKAPRTAVVAAVEGPFVEAIVAGIRAAGFDVRDIRPAHPTPVALSLLPGAERGDRRRTRLRRLAWTGAATVTMWVALGIALAVRQRRALAEVNAELAALDRPIQALLVARSRSDEVSRMTAAVRTADRDGARLSQLLVGVARVLPDSAFLTSVALRADGSGTLSGAARHPADLVVRLERSGLLVSPRLEGQGVREEIGGREMERFTVVFGGTR